VCRLPCAHSKAGPATQPMFASARSVCCTTKGGYDRTETESYMKTHGLGNPDHGAPRGWLRPSLQP
jgi:hypothetical protein